VAYPALIGPIDWSMERDDRGYRVYHVTVLIETLPNQGIIAVLNTGGLPIIGAPYLLTALGDIDLWVWLRPYIRVKRHQPKQGELTRFYTLELKFSNEPIDNERQFCDSASIQNPLMEPMKISGTFGKYTKEVQYDRFGGEIVNSAFERITGQSVEFDQLAPTVTIEQNYGLLDLAKMALLANRVNDLPLWGLPARHVKLSSISWERHFYGLCFYYYTRKFDFEINYDGWDREVIDEGTKYLNGHWQATSGAFVQDEIAVGVPADPTNPNHFIRAIDRNGNPTKLLLNGAGLPADVELGTGTGTFGSTGLGTIRIEYYKEGNFLSLGIPLSLGV
jgi:hypothetical protein